MFSNVDLGDFLPVIINVENDDLITSLVSLIKGRSDKSRNLEPIFLSDRDALTCINESTYLGNIPKLLPMVAYVSTYLSYYLR